MSEQTIDGRILTIGESDVKFFIPGVHHPNIVHVKNYAEATAAANKSDLELSLVVSVPFVNVRQTAYRFVQEFRQNKKYSNVPIVIFSGIAYAEPSQALPGEENKLVGELIVTSGTKELVKGMYALDKNTGNISTARKDIETILKGMPYYLKMEISEKNARGSIDRYDFERVEQFLAKTMYQSLILKTLKLDVSYHQADIFGTATRFVVTQEQDRKNLLAPIENTLQLSAACGLAYTRPLMKFNPELYKPLSDGTAI